MSVVTDPTPTPAPSSRPPSLSTADVYGSYATGIPSTGVMGTVGQGNADAAANALDAETPLRVSAGVPSAFLSRPAGVLVILLVALALLSMDG